MRIERIRAIANRRTIPSLVHFTRTSNLESIAAHGLVPRDQMEERRIAATINDPLRLDRRLSYISTSIAFPNGSMFYRLRNDNPDEEWAILLLGPSTLWRKEVLFCRHNAADARIRRIPNEDLQRSRMLEDMFTELEGLPSRAEQRLKPCDPTDVQAEVLVKGVIEPELIRSVVFNTNGAKERFGPFFGDRPLYVHRGRKGYFANRSYYRIRN